MKMKNKRGFVYFIELIFTVLIVLIIIAGFISSKQGVFEYRKVTDLREEAWYTLNNLDEVGTLENINFSELRDYVRESLLSTIDFDIEYYNSSNATICHNISIRGELGSADNCLWINTTTRQDVVSVMYTFANSSKADSYRLYLWERL